MDRPESRVALLGHRPHAPSASRAPRSGGGRSRRTPARRWWCRPARSAGARPRNRPGRRARRRQARRSSIAASSAPSALSAMCLPGTASRITRGCASPCQLDVRDRAGALLLPAQQGCRASGRRRDRFRSAARGYPARRCARPAPRRPASSVQTTSAPPGFSRSTKPSNTAPYASALPKKSRWSASMLVTTATSGCTPAATRRSRRPRRRSSPRCRGGRWCLPRRDRRPPRTTGQTRCAATPR